MGTFKHSWWFVPIACCLSVWLCVLPTERTKVSSGSTSGVQHLPTIRSAIVTPQFAASDEDVVLNVHIVPHTHDDVGWLKTVEEYYYGFNSTIQHAHVQAILDSTMQALLKNPNRTFTYVEQKFFSMWWSEQNDGMKDSVKKLVLEERLSFVNGGWCMHDEATTHFMGMIDQTTLGHSFLKKELGVVPTVGWQLDPFGHSSSQASYMTSLMGFDALYFGRIDYQDRKIRQETQECEGLWDSSSNRIGGPVFWGLTGSYGGNYGPPGGFCFDCCRCEDVPLVGLDDDHLLARIEQLMTELKVQSDSTKGNHIMLTMGEDFNYENAEIYLKNIDYMITSVHRFQDNKQIDVPSIFGPRFERLNLFYSNPNYYTKQKYVQTRRLKSSNELNSVWSTKSDDFFPYADFDHAYWTGYFVSRTGFKRLERVASSFLMAARQVESYKTNQSVAGCECMQPLYELEDALGVAQHHDAVSGTAKQHVANDYAKRVQAGMDKAASFFANKMREIFFGAGQVDGYLDNLGYCQLLNESICEISEHASRNGDDLYVLVYNALASTRSSIVGIPVSQSGPYTVAQVDQLHHSTKSPTVSLPSGDKMIVYFDTGPLPPAGAIVLKLTLQPKGNLNNNTTLGTKQQRSLKQTGESASRFKVILTDDKSVQISGLNNDFAVDVRQRWGYYTSFDAEIDKPGTQNSGAYIFRPSEPDQALKVIRATKVHKRTISDLINEVHVEYDVPWIKETFRSYKGKNYMEVEYQVGPIPIDDARGKEIVTQYATGIKNKGVFYTDSNGREFQKRVRSSRPTWNLTEYEPIAGNYYPVNTAIYVEDQTRSMGIVTDRTQGGSSLEDGSIELMVQRRTLVDDGRGVDEPLNETDGCVTPYPPYGTATRYGDGVVIRGKHRILVSSVSGGASLVRSEMDSAFSEPIIFVGSAKQGSEVPFDQLTFSLIESSLPPNVMLITYKPLISEPKKTFLIRIGHQYAQGEDERLAKPVSVDLKKLVGGHIVSCTEKTLSANRDLAEWQSVQIDWTGNSVPPVRQMKAYTQGDCAIQLKPMEIRTFQIQIDP